LAVLCSARAADPVYKSKHFVVLPDRVVEGEYSARALSPMEIASNYPLSENAQAHPNWVLKGDISRYPRLHSDYPLIDAVYNMSLEELQQDIRKDGAFMAGAKWEGVWTRDISYSILLSLAGIEPEVAKASLLRKVKNDRIIQDTGTGGSWPVSSDRMTWALAAWEIYRVTGDRDWLRRSFNIIRASALDDVHVVLSASTGLAQGESSFLDWREQTYPRWMTPVDIYNAQALGTNAVFYRTYRILASMARLLGEPAERWDQMADRIRDALNGRLWIPDRGYYGQYLYGRMSLSLSPRSEALGEALAILFNIPDPAKQDTILRSVPVLEYGIPCILPGESRHSAVS
jgi:glycogen debranching enzyme